jgi:hypothetical protein
VLKVPEAQDEVPECLGEGLGRVLLGSWKVLVPSWGSGRDLGRILWKSWGNLGRFWGRGSCDPKMGPGQVELAAGKLRVSCKSAAVKYVLCLDPPGRSKIL